MTLSDSRPNRHPNRAVEAAALVQDGSPPITRNTFPTCHAHYPGGPRWVHVSVASPSRAAFPDIQAGRRPRLHFRGLLRLHTRYGPPDRSTAQSGLCHEASTSPVARQSRSSATGPYRQLSGWHLPPLVFRAIGAHVESRRGAVTGVMVPFPLPAHQTGRAGFPHPAFRLASSRSTRRRAEMDTPEA
jgi:hypothetical protein